MNARNTAAFLEFYADLGVDECMLDAPPNRYEERAAAPTAAPKPVQNHHAATQPQLRSAAAPAYEQPASKQIVPAPAALMGPDEHQKKARAAADAATSLEQLRSAVEVFDGCSIKKTATHTVFSDGNPESDMMLVGEAPGAEEDRQGIPFCGPSGQLLDKMFAAIGRDRTQLYISNALFWRPPGNRKPSTEELMACLPFVEKHIALINPRLLILIGGTATTALLNESRGITRLRGQEFAYDNAYLASPIPTVALYHPSYLLRQPAHKRLAWQDLLKIKDIMERAT